GAVGTRFILNDDRLSQDWPKLVGNRSGNNICSTTRGNRHNQGNGFIRPSTLCRNLCCTKGAKGSDCCNTQQFPDIDTFTRSKHNHLLSSKKTRSRLSLKARKGIRKTI